MIASCFVCMQPVIKTTDICESCGRPISAYEIALHRKLVNRGAKTFLCKTCLARLYKLSEEDLDKMAEYFKRLGCTLFP